MMTATDRDGGQVQAVAAYIRGAWAAREAALGRASEVLAGWNRRWMPTFAQTCCHVHADMDILGDEAQGDTYTNTRLVAYED